MKTFLCLGLFLLCGSVDGMKLREETDEEDQELFSVHDPNNIDENTQATKDALMEIRRIFKEVHDPEDTLGWDDKAVLTIGALGNNLEAFKEKMSETFDNPVHHKREQAKKVESQKELSKESGDWFDHNPLRDMADARKAVNWANLDCTCPAFFSAAAWVKGGGYWKQQKGGTQQANHCDDRPGGAAFKDRTSRPKFKTWHAHAIKVWNKREEGGIINVETYRMMCPKCPPQSTSNTGAAFVRKMARVSAKASDHYVADDGVPEWKRNLAKFFNYLPMIKGKPNIFALMYHMAPKWDAAADKATEAPDLGLFDTVYNPPR